MILYSNKPVKAVLQIHLLAVTAKETTYPPHSPSHKILLTGTGTTQGRNYIYKYINFVSLLRAFFWDKHTACFICGAGQTSSWQNVSKSPP